MTRATSYRVLGATILAVVAIGVACRQVVVLKDPLPVANPAYVDGVVADIVEAESEPLLGTNSAARNSAGDQVIVARKTPTLPKPIDAMTNAEIVSYLNSLRYKTGAYNTHSANVPCVHEWGGESCADGDSAHVFIQPEAGMNKWEYSTIPTNGLIVARIINDAPVGRDAAIFGYPAQYKTWWVVDKTSGSIRARYFVRTYSPTGRAIRFVGPPGTRPFVRCVHADAPPGRAARGKFWTCPESAVGDTGMASGARRDASPVRAATLESYIHPVSLRSAVPLLPAPPAPLQLVSNWVSCGGGCCATN